MIYQIKPDNKAFAAAVDIENGKVARFAIGEAINEKSIDEAIVKAIKFCKKNRRKGNIKDKCQLYAKNAEIIKKT